MKIMICWRTALLSAAFQGKRRTGRNAVDVNARHEAPITNEQGALALAIAAREPSHSEATIEISLRKLQQLFNSPDPSPFHDRDLDHDAEEYIVGSAEEIALQRPCGTSASSARVCARGFCWNDS